MSRKLALLLGAVCVVAGAAALAWACLWSAQCVFLRQDPRAAWITWVPDPQWTGVWSGLPAVRFVRPFTVPAGGPGQITLELRAVRRVRVLVNGAPVFHRGRDGEARWREAVRLQVPVHPGEDLLEVDVQDPLGPPLLQLHGEGLADSLATGAGWQVLAQGRLVPAPLADDTHPAAIMQGQPTTLQVLRQTWPVLLLLAGASALAYLLRRRWQPSFTPRAAAAAVGLVWFGLFLRRTWPLPFRFGYDAPWHLEYINLLLDQHRLPLAGEGWSTYHPPLFYVVAAALVRALRPLLGPVHALQCIKLVPFLCGLGSVAVAGGLGRRLFPEDPPRQAAAVLCAGLLPMNVYISAYPSNESLHALLAGAALLETVRLLGRRGLRGRDALLLGALLGLALLTKFTALLLLPPVGAVLLLKIVADRGGARRALGVLAALAAGVALLAGWYYLRNLLHFGRLLVGNWDPAGSPGGKGWWQLPGFHDAAYYTGFGESLWRPYFSGWRSYWDSLYSTLWGDGYLGGLRRPEDRHPAWSYRYMALCYPLALPATLLVLAGAIRAAARVLRPWPEGEAAAPLSWLLLLGVTGVVQGATLLGTLRLPYYGQAKSFYGLCLTAPLALFFAEGLSWLDRRLRGRAARVLLYTWLGTLAGVIVLAFSMGD